MTQTADILVSGGGVAGLTAAAAFGAAGFRVTVVDPQPPVTAADAPGADLRTTAILQPGRALMQEAGLWDLLDGEAAPLSVMRIAEAGADGRLALMRDFRADDLAQAAFGWNLPNWLLRQALVARLAQLPEVDFRPGFGTRSLVARDREVRVLLTDGSTVAARMLVAADGRDSPVRQALGIGVRTTRYGQTALSFSVTHPVPHDGVSTEIHRDGGPFTLVPLPDRGGVPCSAVVWMDRAAEAARRLALPPAEFAAEATERSCHAFGPLALAGGRAAWPIVTQVATALTGPRTALVAEAAHVMPPIGAQGLNTSLADIACLLRLACADRDGLGDAAMLAAYARRRHPEVIARAAGVDALNRASIAGGGAWREVRGRVMAMMHDLAPVRRGLMRLGMGD
jgi:2-octaprenyl-6-methoxyphenol hydroxylase